MAKNKKKTQDTDDDIPLNNPKWYKAAARSSHRPPFAAEANAAMPNTPDAFAETQVQDSYEPDSIQHDAQLPETWPHK